VRKAVGHQTIGSEVNKNICEAVGCFAKATTTIEVKVGQEGLISLSLCEDCIKKFGDD
jgi:hypothetical protein